MASRGSITYIILGLCFVIALATPSENSGKEFKSNEIDFDDDTDDEGKNIIFPTANGGLGITFGFLNTSAITDFFSIGFGTGLTGLGIGFALLLALGVAAAITLAIVLPIAIGVGVYKKLMEEETGFSGSGSYGNSGYSASGSGYAAPANAAPTYGGFSEQSTYSIYRSLEEAARKFLDTNEKQ